MQPEPRKSLHTAVRPWGPASARHSLRTEERRWRPRVQGLSAHAGNVEARQAKGESEQGSQQHRNQEAVKAST